MVPFAALFVVRFVPEAKQRSLESIQELWGQPPSDVMTLALESSDARLEIDPPVGGAISRYRVRGREVLRRASADTRDVLDMACFPLVPFVNRIAYGSFCWEDRTIALRRNFGDHPHVLHGQGWQRPWEIASQSHEHAVLRFSHEPDDWPWTYVAEQAFALTGTALQVTLSVTNRSDRNMPVSLGFHPFFPRRGATCFETQTNGVWLSDATQLPTELATPARVLDLSHVALTNAPFVDNCYTGWRVPASILQPEDSLRIALSASAEAHFLQFFSPTGADYFCAEPMSAMPDAVNRPEPAQETGLRTLVPGATFAVSMTIAPQDIRRDQPAAPQSRSLFPDR
jgi:aldose 1-epimerase